MRRKRVATAEQYASKTKRGVVLRLYDWVLHWAQTPYGLVALILVAVSESSFFPIPPPYGVRPQGAGKYPDRSFWMS